MGIFPGDHHRFKVALRPNLVFCGGYPIPSPLESLSSESPEQGPGKCALIAWRVPYRSRAAHDQRSSVLMHYLTPFRFVERAFF
jgi:hypothetical protein